MKRFQLLIFYCFIVFISCVSCLDHSLEEFELERNDSIITRNVGGELVTAPQFAAPWDPPPAGPIFWQTMVCKGQKLLLGMTLNPEHAINFVSPLTTPWTSGDFWDHMTRWGYFDDSDEDYRGNDCDMDRVYQLGRALRDVGINPDSNHRGGPNRCFSAIHCNGPAVERIPNGDLPPRSEQYYIVNGVRYRVTDAHFTIGVNAESGVIYLISRASPESEARMLWETNWIEKDELPALRSSSDFAWGFWTRMSPGNLGNINKFLSMTITNDATQAIIRRILLLRGGTTDLGDVPTWPGWTYTSNQEEYHALIATPNSVGIAYFLIQHKEQLGGNKYISKITLFRSDSSSHALPYLMYWVENAPPSPPPPPEGSQDMRANYAAEDFESRLVKRDVEWTNVVRENVVWIKAH